MAAGRGEGSGPGLVDIRNTHVTETTQTVTLGLSCLCGVWLWVAVTPSLKQICYIYSKRHIPWSNHIFYYVSLLRTFHFIGSQYFGLSGISSIVSPEALCLQIISNKRLQRARLLQAGCGVSVCGPPPDRSQPSLQLPGLFTKLLQALICF